MKREPQPVDTRGMMNSVAFSPTHIHIKTNKVYDLICVGETEANGEMLVTYWDYHGRVWVRSVVDFFNNNRFREVTKLEFEVVKRAMELGIGRHMCLRPNHEYHKGFSTSVFESASEMLRYEYLFEAFRHHEEIQEGLRQNK